MGGRAGGVGGGLNRLYEYSILALSSVVDHMHIQVVRSGLMLSVTDHCHFVCFEDDLWMDG